MYIFDIGLSETSENFFRVQKIARVQCPMHTHFHPELVFVSGGRLIMNVNGTDRVISAGQATFILPFEQHSFHTPEDSDCVVIEFAPSLVEEFYSDIKNKLLVNEVFELSEKDVAFCGSLSEGNPNLLTIKAALYPLCYKINQACRFSPGGRAPDETFIKAVKHLSENFRNETLSLTETAKALGIHHVYLSRIFARNAGISFTKYLALLRCSKAAKTIISEPDKNISEIAFECGFGSIRSFNRQFFETFGSTPTEYRPKSLKEPSQ